MSKSTLKRFHEATASSYSKNTKASVYLNDLNDSVERMIYEQHVDTPSRKEAVDHPDHYNEGIETIDYIESWEMDFSQGNIIKYVSRYKSKGGLEDLKKAQWYLERLIQKEEENV
jgi:hypothetical protein